MRRKDREVVGLSNILAILDKCDVLRIGLCTNNRPYVVPMNFAYERDDEKVFIYLHCAHEGKKIDIIKANNYVCFEADCSYKLLTAGTACNYSAEFQSVIGEGIIEILSDERQKIRGLDALMKRYGFEGKPQYSPQGLRAVTVLKISAGSITAKAKPATT